MNALSTQALRSLEEGNDRFAAQPRKTGPDSAGPHQGHADTGRPLAAVLTCADPGVSPEAIFDQPPQSLFVVRAAAHVLDDVIIGSLEYAVGELKVPLVVVLGHDGCRLMAEALKEPAATGSLGVLLDGLEQPVLRARRGSWPLDMLLHQAVRENVLQTLADLRTSHNIHPYLDEGRVALAGGIYREHRGVVEWLEGRRPV